MANAHDYFVISRDSATFRDWQGFNADVHWGSAGGSNGLSNGGEDVSLRNASGATIDSVDYEDGNSSTETGNGWLPSTDGTGPSLERIHPNLNGAASTNLAWVFCPVTSKVID